MTFTISDCKTEKCWNQTFFISSYPRYVRLQNRVCQILIMTLEHVAMPFFAEISWNSAKVIVFFLEKGEKIGSWFHYIWITWWLTFFLESIYFFRFLPSPGRNRMLNLDQKYELCFCKSLKFSKILQTLFFSAWILPQNVKMLAKLEHIWASKGPKTPQKGLFDGCWIGMQNFGNV